MHPHLFINRLAAGGGVGSLLRATTRKHRRYVANLEKFIKRRVFASLFVKARESAPMDADASES